MRWRPSVVLLTPSSSSSTTLSTMATASSRIAKMDACLGKGERGIAMPLGGRLGRLRLNNELLKKDERELLFAPISLQLLLDP
jgi:hypothetical protein